MKKKIVNENHTKLMTKLAKAKEESSKRKNFITFEDVDKEKGTVVFFPLDGEMNEEERGEHTYNVYRPSVAVVVEQQTGKIIKVKKDSPSVPSNTLLCGRYYGKKWKKGRIEEAKDAGHTFMAIFDHELVSYIDKNGDKKKYHDCETASHGDDEDFISRYVTEALEK